MSHVNGCFRTSSNRALQSYIDLPASDSKTNVADMPDMNFAHNDERGFSKATQICSRNPPKQTFLKSFGVHTEFRRSYSGWIY